MAASRTKGWPALSTILPSLNWPTRILGPCRSAMMPTARPTLRQISRTSSARRMWSSAVPCEKFRRTTSTPARNMRSSVAASLEAGPRVATILVLLCMSLGFHRLRGALLKDLDGGKRLALEEFEKGAAAGGDVADPVGDAVLGNGRERVAAARDGEGGRGGDRLGDGARAVLEGGELE